MIGMAMCGAAARTGACCVQSFGLVGNPIEALRRAPPSIPPDYLSDLMLGVVRVFALVILKVWVTIKGVKGCDSVVGQFEQAAVDRSLDRLGSRDHGNTTR